MNWLMRLKMAKNENSRGLDDGGLGIGGKLFPGQSILFPGDPSIKREKNVHKKNKRKRPERPGEQEPV